MEAICSDVQAKSRSRIHMVIDYTKAPGKILSLKELQEIYVAIVEEHGEKAYSCEWMSKNGYNWLYLQSLQKHKIKWNDFRKQCGINNELNLEDIIKKYQSIVDEYGEKAYRSQWILKNGYSWIYTRISKKHGLEWNDFKAMCGFNNKLRREILSIKGLIEEYKSIVKEHGKKAYSSEWIAKNEYGWLYQQVTRKHKIKWDEFRIQCEIDIKLNRFMTLEELIEEYKSIVKEYGKKAYSSEWIAKNEYGWLYEQVSKKHKISWKQFIQMCKLQVEVDFEW